MRPQANLGIGYRSKDFAVQQLVAQLAAEALGEPILSRAAWGDVVRRGATPGKPSLDLGSDELRAIMAAHETRCAAQSEQRLQDRKHGLVGEGHATRDRKPLAGELVQDVQEPYLALKQQAVLLEVVAPNVVWPLGLTRDDAPCPDLKLYWGALLGALRHLKPALLSGVLHALVVNE